MISDGMRVKNVVIGGGIAGLAALWRLKDQETLLLESQDRVGGWIGRLEGSPFPFPLGPRTIRCQPNGALVQLLKEVGLSPLPPPSNMKRYVFWRGQLHEMKLSSPLFKGIKKDLFLGLIKSIPKKDCSAASFFRTHFSNEVASRLCIPFLRGVFGQDGEALSMKSAFPWMSRGPLIRHLFGKKSQFLSLSGGIFSLVEKLEEKLSSHISLGEKVIKLEKGKVTTTKRDIACERIISTLPLENIPHSSITSVHLYWEKKLPQVNGFGYLVSPEEKGNVLGAIFDSELVSAHCTAITMMLSGLVEGKEEALDAIKRHLKISQLPDDIKISFAKEAIPSYPVGYKETKQRYLQETHDWMISLGTSISGISVNDVVEGAFAWKL